MSHSNGQIPPTGCFELKKKKKKINKFLFKKQDCRMLCISWLLPTAGVWTPCLAWEIQPSASPPEIKWCEWKVWGLLEDGGDGWGTPFPGKGHTRPFWNVLLHCTVPSTGRSKKHWAPWGWLMWERNANKGNKKLVASWGRGFDSGWEEVFSAGFHLGFEKSPTKVLVSVLRP